MKWERLPLTAAAIVIMLSIVIMLAIGADSWSETRRLLAENARLRAENARLHDRIAEFEHREEAWLRRRHLCPNRELFDQVLEMLGSYVVCAAEHDVCENADNPDQYLDRSLEGLRMEICATQAGEQAGGSAP